MRRISPRNCNTRFVAPETAFMFFHILVYIACTYKGLCVYIPDTSNNQNMQYSAVQLPSGLRIGALVCLWWVKTLVGIHTPFIDNITPWSTQSGFGSHSKIISANVSQSNGGRVYTCLQWWRTCGSRGA